MSENGTHITEYKTLARVLLALLVLTCITVLVTSFDLKVWNVFVALLIASVKVFIVLAYFMHLKHESRLLKLLVGGIFLLYAAVIIITYLDYLYR
jgi:cytochrome c oxidase subunit IV